FGRDGPRRGRGRASAPVASTLGRPRPMGETAAPPKAAPHRLSRISLRPPAAAPEGVVQRAKAPKRQKKTRYGLAPYRRSSKFRFIRWRRRQLTGFATKAKAGINMFTVKYKLGGKSYYLTTRSVPSTNAGSFNLAAGHSEARFKLLRKRFEKKHGLKKKHIQWGATEREPCGVGSGMANCRSTLSDLGIPNNKIFFGHEYADREDMRKNKGQSSSSLNQEASTHRLHHNTELEKDVKWLSTDYDSESESEDESDVVDEYEEDYGEKKPKKRKRPLKKVAGAFRGGF
ncbi:MAG: hypothetical protein AAFY88_29510, partial [Acidobacteriota bacterium]